MLHRFAKTFLKNYQKIKLKQSLTYAYNTSPFYHTLFNTHNLKPSDITSYNDLIKIPLTNPEQLQKDPQSFFSVPQEKFIKVFTTTGSAGKSKKIFFTQRDINSRPFAK